MIPSDCSGTHTEYRSFQSKGVHMCVASLNSFILDGMKAHSKQSYHHHTSVKIKKAFPAPFFVILSSYSKSEFPHDCHSCYPPTDCVLQMPEKSLKVSPFSYPKGIPSLLQLGLINTLGKRGVYDKGGSKLGLTEIILNSFGPYTSSL